MTKTSSLYILIAEDDVDDGDIIVESFSNHPGFSKVELVNNGAELVASLAKGEQPDIILTDINMPILDGIEALKEIHSNRAWRDIPTFVYSTSINPAYEARCVELGCKGFLIKPYSLQGFNDIPDKILSSL